MEVLLSKHCKVTSAWGKEVAEGVWHTVDTSFLFDNQYNLASGERVFDRDVRAVRDDARVGLAKCPYCGAIVPEGEQCHANPECSNYTPRSLSGIFTKYNNETVPFRVLPDEYNGTIDLIPGRNSYCLLRREYDDDVTYRLTTSRANARLVFIGDDIYAESIGWRRVVVGGMNSFPYIPKYAMAALRKFLAEVK